MFKRNLKALSAVAAILLFAGSAAADQARSDRPAVLGPSPATETEPSPQIAERRTCAQLGYRCVQGYVCRAFVPPIRQPDRTQWAFMCVPKTRPRCPAGYASRNVRSDGSYTCEPLAKRVVRRCQRGERMVRVAGMQSFRCAPRRGTPNCRTPQHGGIMESPVRQGAAYICRFGL